MTLTQKRGLGTDVAIVGSMIFVAQIIVSMTIGSFIEWLDTPATVLYGASILGLASSISAYFVLYV